MHVKRPTGTQVQDGEGKMIVVAVGENTYQESLLAEKPKDSNEAAEECTYAYLSYTHLSHACLLRVLPCSPICPQKVQAIFQSTYNNLFDTTVCLRGIFFVLTLRAFCLSVLCLLPLPSSFVLRFLFFVCSGKDLKAFDHAEEARLHDPHDHYLWSLLWRR